MSPGRTLLLAILHLNVMQASCAGHQAAKRAAAVGIGAAGAGAAAAARSCSDDSAEACRRTATVQAVVVLGLALSAWATAYLSETAPGGQKINGENQQDPPAPPASQPWRAP